MSILLKVVFGLGFIFLGCGLVLGIKKKEVKIILSGVVLAMVCFLGGIGLFEESEQIAVVSVTNNVPEPDTSVFVDADKVVVADTRDPFKQLDLTVYMSRELSKGLATQQVLNQSYDFLQQNDIAGADKVKIGVMHGNSMVFIMTVNTQDFVPIDTDPMAYSVLKAATVEKISDEVREYGEKMELW